ncbi:RNA-guided endonuclease InsQ/TnpB family protein [Actinomadura nitritigenes]|uniref:RNA-guided endonuclease InsQ/TnpB family protein n=1 Tax=Actinomadura nitritigenes TaxID=134602 RepID=UPI003D917C06
MCRYRLRPTPAQQAELLKHCGHARFVWNLAVEQHAHWRPGRASAPGFAEQCRQLTQARAEWPWLREGSVTVQQQALKDFTQAMANYFKGTHRRPNWRKAGRHEGFRIVALKPEAIRRLSRHTGELRVPKVGWVRFRWSRPIPPSVRSYRVTRDRAGRWHVAFAHVPDAIPAPRNGENVGVDRGVTVSAALSTGQLLHAPGLKGREAERLLRLQRTLARAAPGSHRRAKVKATTARLKAREADRRKDWVEKTSTALARGFDVIAVEDLDMRGMVRSARGTVDAPGRNVAQKSGLNRAVLAAGWGALVRRLEDKAPGRILRVDPRYTSQTCNACGHRASENRESQAVFRCTGCGYRANADVNAAMNIRDTAAGHAVAARGALQPVGGAVNREPQPDLLSTWERLESPRQGRGEDVNWAGRSRRSSAARRARHPARCRS